MACRLLAAGLLLLAMSAMPVSQAAEPRVLVGVGSSFMRGAAPALDLAVTTTRGAPGDARWQYELTMVGRSTFMDRVQGNQTVLSAMLVDHVGGFDAGIGIARMQHVDNYNGSPWNFSLMFAYRLDRWPISIELRHWSNAGFKYPNVGRNLVFVAWRF
jgi:hypothetical protein